LYIVDYPLIMFCHDFRLRHRKSRQNGYPFFILPRTKCGVNNITLLRSFSYNHSPARPYRTGRSGGCVEFIRHGCFI